MPITSQIKKDIPQRIAQFPKLISGRPYYFLAWKNDRGGVECLYYRFKNATGKTEQIKKVPLRELESAVRMFQHKGTFDRSDYQNVCPAALSSGPCGFAVIGRYLEFRHNAKYNGRGKGFSL